MGVKNYVLILLLSVIFKAQSDLRDGPAADTTREILSHMWGLAISVQRRPSREHDIVGC